MIDISKGRYWDKAWSLVDGCTPCSPGCDHCWSAAMAKRFHPYEIEGNNALPLITDKGDHFNGRIVTRPDRLDIPGRTRKPTVFAVWNELFHEDVSDEFREAAFAIMETKGSRHTYLLLTKRPHIMSAFINHPTGKHLTRDNVWKGLTVCNQQEADEKIPVFLQVPGKKFLSIEPMLGAIDLIQSGLRPEWKNPEGDPPLRPLGTNIDAVILGGETGVGARPMHPDWVRKVRDDCEAAGVPFFFKGCGAWKVATETANDNYKYHVINKPRWHIWGDKIVSRQVGHKFSGRLLDGREHNDLPWRTP